MAIKPDDLEKIVDYTMGTCQSIDEVLVKFGYDELDLDSAMYIDERIFCCGNCEWWFEIGEMADDWEEFADEPACEDCVRYELV
jgi:hypothetical protein